MEASVLKVASRVVSGVESPLVPLGETVAMSAVAPVGVPKVGVAATAGVSTAISGGAGGASMETLLRDTLVSTTSRPEGTPGGVTEVGGVSTVGVGGGVIELSEVGVAGGTTGDGVGAVAGVVIGAGASGTITAGDGGVIGDVSAIATSVDS